MADGPGSSGSFGTAICLHFYGHVKTFVAPVKNGSIVPNKKKHVACLAFSLAPMTLDI